MKKWEGIPLKTKHNGLIPLIAIVVLLTALVLGLLFVVLRYHIVDMKFYPKNSTVLDLTDKTITVSHYEKLQALLPECDIRWNVPFQGKALADNVTEVTVTELTVADAETLTLLTDLKTVHAKDCRDYAVLMYLQELMPQLKVDYHVLISGTYYGPETTVVKADSITRDEILSMQYLPNLTKVVAAGSQAQSDYTPLRNFCLNTDVEFALYLAGKEVAYDARNLSLENLGDEEIYLLQYLEQPEKLHLINPEADPDKVLALRSQFPAAKVTWEVELAGESYPDTTTEVDLSQEVVKDLAQVERTMGYFPDAELLILGLCGIDNPQWGNSKMDKKLAVSAINNEDIAAFRDRVKDQFKVVWTVRLGPSIALRTDADNFMPNHFGVGRLPDDYAHNLRYCTDMVCLDLGHMTVTHIDFVEYMPKLKYLILAWTNVKYIEPIRNCKELIFLELDNSAIRDLAPLVDCTALQDLNIGNAWPDISALLEMPWLKNVYMIFGSSADAWKISQACPDTRVVTSGNATVGGGWRRMQNYYDMRDMLHAPYMN